MEEVGDVSNGPGAGSVAKDIEFETRRAMQRLDGFVRDIDVRTRAFVREHPTTAVIAAVAIGFLVGRILVRR